MNPEANLLTDCRTPELRGLLLSWLKAEGYAAFWNSPAGRDYLRRNPGLRAEVGAEEDPAAFDAYDTLRAHAMGVLL